MLPQTPTGPPPPAPPRAPTPWWVPGTPALTSLLLSAATVGAHPSWQDSGLYLSAVSDLGVLYAPGFVLYLLSCKAWTLLVAPLFGFTLAVHLFSSLSAAAAAGTLSLAALEFTGHRAAAAVTGVLAATGYTWAYSAIYAKGYALYYLLLTLLLWRLLRKDVASSAFLIGLAWNAHPSMALFSPVLLGLILFHRKELLKRGPLRLAGLAAAGILCAIGPILLVPWMASRDPVFSLGNPRTLKELIPFALGKHFMSIRGTWGLDAGRWTSAALFLWEEFLPVGLAALAVGVVGLWRRDRSWIAWGALWCLPFVVVTLLFKIEGQHDFWLVAIYILLYLGVARGIADLAVRWKWIPPVAAGVGLSLAVALNAGELRRLGLDTAERLGECHLKQLEPGAILVASTDDSLGLTNYLQRVKKTRLDVCLVNSNLLSPMGDWEWYVGTLQKRFPDLVAPNYISVSASAEEWDPHTKAVVAFVNANARRGRPLYVQMEPPDRLLLPGLHAVPAGILWRITVDGKPEKPDFRHWQLPLKLEDAKLISDRRRGQVVVFLKDDLQVSPESYRDRCLKILLESMQREAYLHHLEQTAEDHRKAVELYQSIISAEPSEGRRAEILFPLSGSLLALKQPEQARPLLLTLLEKPLSPMMEAASRCYLADIAEAGGRPDEARSQLQQALKRPNLDDRMRQFIESRLHRK